MADVRPALPTASAGDQRPVFELLNGHLCLEVSAIAMADLDDHIRDSQIRFHLGSHGVIAVFLYGRTAVLLLRNPGQGSGGGPGTGGAGGGPADPIFCVRKPLDRPTYCQLHT
jgi:hypothetical protein